MKKLFTFLALFLYFSGAFAQVDTIPKLIISEWRGNSWYSGYMELTNVGDSALDLSAFTYTGAGFIKKNTMESYNPKDNQQVRLSGILLPGESYVGIPVYEQVDDNGDKIHRELMMPIADLHGYRLETKLPLGVVDSASAFDEVFKLWGRYFSALYYNYPSGDSVLIDAVNNSWNEVKQGWGGIVSDVAGVPEATKYRILVRKADITTGNTDWDNVGKGVSSEDSQWLLLPNEQKGGDYDYGFGNLQHYTTVKVHGDYHIDLTSSVIDINWNDSVITVPWGIMKWDSIMNEFNIGPNMAWHYSESPVVADSAHVICQTGDTLQVFACGNILETALLRIEIASPAENSVLAFPLRHMNDESGIWEARYYVTEGESVMDIIGDVPFAERVDTLMAHLEIASNASWEIVWVDGAERTDLKYGDIFKVIAADGTTIKEYFIDVLDYAQSDNALLASITWPDMPGFISDAWTGDTIPGFNPTSSSFRAVLPAGTENVPALVAKAQDVNAAIEVDRAISLSGGLDERTTTFTVTSESDTIETVYTVTFEVGKDYVNLQPYTPDPFFTEFVARIGGGNSFVEIVNSSNIPLSLENYMIVQSNDIKNPSDAITQRGGAEDYNHRYCKYVPGYKFTKDTAEWRINPEFLIQDGSVDPYVDAGGVFVIMQAHGNVDEVSAEWIYANVIMYPPISLVDDPDTHPATNTWGEELNKYDDVSNTVACNYFLFKIIGDSILDGTKGLSDPDDFELVDVFGDPVNDYYTIGGVAFNIGDESKSLSLYLKPDVDDGKELIGEGFGTNADDTDWMFKSLNVFDHDGLKYAAEEITNTVGFHEMDPVTKFMSTISSLVYKVSVGYSDNESVRGVVDGTSVDGFIANIDVPDAGMTLVFKGDAEKTAADVLVNGDSLMVTSTDLTSTTTYVLDVTAIGLDADANLTAAAGSEYVIDITGVTGTVSGIVYGTTIADALAGVVKPVNAILNVINSAGNLIPMQILNNDNVLVATNVSTDVFFEVIAENGTTIITYNLVPTSVASDAFVVSDIYAVDQELMTISNIPDGTTVTSFLNNLTPVTGATLIIKDKLGFERTTGYVSYDDLLYVTSEDASVTVSYYLTFLLEMYPDMANSAPVVTITTASFSIEPDATISLDATVTDDGNPAPSTITYLWEVTSGDAGAVTIVNPDQLISDASFSATGSFELQLTVSDGDLTGTGTIAVLVSGVGVENWNTDFVSIYPNPVKSILFIDLSNVQTAKSTIRLVDVTGQVIYMQNHTESKIEIDLNEFASGIYFLNITVEKQNIVKKIQIAE